MIRYKDPQNIYINGGTVFFQTPGSPFGFPSLRLEALEEQGSCRAVMFRASGSIAWKGGRLEDPWLTPVPFAIVGQDQDEWRHPSGAGLDRLQTVITKNHQSGDYYHWTGPRRVAPFKRCRSGTSKQFIIINDARWSRPSFEQDQDEWRLPSGAGLDRSKTIVISIKSLKMGSSRHEFVLKTANGGRLPKPYWAMMRMDGRIQRGSTTAKLSNGLYNIGVSNSI